MAEAAAAVSADTLMMGGLLATLASTGFKDAVQRAIDREDKRYRCEILFSDLFNSRDKLLFFKLMSDFGKKTSKMKKFQVAYARVKLPTPRQEKAYRDSAYINQFGDPIIEQVLTDEGEPLIITTSHKQMPFNLPKQGFDVLDKKKKKTSIKPILQGGELLGYELRMSHTFVNVLYDVLKRSKDHFTDDQQCAEAFNTAFWGCLSSDVIVNVRCPADEVSYWRAFGNCLKVAGFVVFGAAIITGIVMAAVYCWPTVAAAAIGTCVAIVATAVVSSVTTVCLFVAAWIKWW